MGLYWFPILGQYWFPVMAQYCWPIHILSSAPKIESIMDQYWQTFLKKMSKTQLQPILIGYLDTNVTECNFQYNLSFLNVFHQHRVPMFYQCCTNTGSHYWQTKLANNWKTCLIQYWLPILFQYWQPVLDQYWVNIGFQ